MTNYCDRIHPKFSQPRKPGHIIQLIVIIPQKKNTLPMQNPEIQTQGFAQNVTRELLGASSMQLTKLA